MNKSILFSLLTFASFSGTLIAMEKDPRLEYLVELNDDTVLVEKDVLETSRIIKIMNEDCPTNDKKIPFAINRSELDQVVPYMEYIAKANQKNHVLQSSITKSPFLQKLVLPVDKRNCLKEQLSAQSLEDLKRITSIANQFEINDLYAPCLESIADYLLEEKQLNSFIENKYFIQSLSLVDDIKKDLAQTIMNKFYLKKDDDAYQTQLNKKWSPKATANEFILLSQTKNQNYKEYYNRSEKDSRQYIFKLSNPNLEKALFIATYNNLQLPKNVLCKMPIKTHLLSIYNSLDQESKRALQLDHPITYFGSRVLMGAGLAANAYIAYQCPGLYAFAAGCMSICFAAEGMDFIEQKISKLWRNK